MKKRNEVLAFQLMTLPLLSRPKDASPSVPQRGFNPKAPLSSTTHSFAIRAKGRPDTTAWTRTYAQERGNLKRREIALSPVATGMLQQWEVRGECPSPLYL